MSARTHNANGKHVGATEKPEKPVALVVIQNNVPAELRAKNQWVMWRYECRDDRWTKPPFCARTGRPASSTDPASWSAFEVACAAYRSGGWDGIGLIHLPDDNLTGGDWDGVRNPDTGEIDPEVAAEIERWDTYAEVSPSGTGIRAYAHGVKPGARSKQGAFEIYSGVTAEGKPGGRFLTVTGHRLPNSPAAINERQAQIDQSYRERWPDVKSNGAQEKNQAGTGNLDDDELLRRARNAKNGDRFTRLMAGDIGLYGGDESRADLALCGELAFWFGPDPTRIDRIFRTSGLMREKWDSRRGEATYGQRTIARALEGKTEFYANGRTPNPPADGNHSPVGEPPVVHSNEAIDDPDRLGRLCLADKRTQGGVLTLRYWREGFYVHDGCAYRDVSEEELRADVHARVKMEFDQINHTAIQRWEEKGRDGECPKTLKIGRGLISNVIDAIKSLTIIPSATLPPVWLDESHNGQLLTLKNGLLDLAAAAVGDRVIIKNSPLWFTHTSLPYAHDLRATCHNWLAFLRMNLEADAERIAILQEWFGLNLTFDTSFHKFLLLEGEGNNGKSVVCAALLAMLGIENCSSVALELFGERFQLTPTIGKLANIVPDCGEIDRIAEGFLKGFVSGDPMTFDRKNKTPLQCMPTARITLAMNMRPRFSDRSAGLWRRMILMPLRYEVDAAQLVSGMDKPEWWRDRGELPGLLNWALEGLRRLKGQGRFTTSTICEEALAGYRLESNPARLFLEERCTANPDPECAVICSDLYAAYKKWALESGYSPLANGKFGQEVKRVFKKMERKQQSRPQGRPWCYVGVSFDPNAS